MNDAGESRGGRSRLFLVLLILLVALAGVLYASKRLAVRRLEHQLEDQKTRLTRASERALVERSKQMLRLAVVPLAWAVRVEMLKKNYSQIDDYFQRLVQEPRVARIALVGEDGKILIATDKRLEGKPADSVLPAGVLPITEAMARDQGDGGTLLAVPVMGFDSRLGILVLEYEGGKGGGPGPPGGPTSPPVGDE